MTKLAVALDNKTKSDFLDTFQKLKEFPLVYKVGLKMLPHLERADWKLFDGKSLFVDAKLHDIPSQVADAVMAYGDKGANFLTVHLSGGRKMLEEAVKAAQPYDLRLLGVSVLTSLSEEDLSEIGFASTAESVERLLRLGIASGLDSFVMSTRELTRSKKVFPHIFCVTPGISFDSGSTNKDQQRTATVQEAVSLHSDLIVMGRAILTSDDPVASVQKVLKILG